MALIKYASGENPSHGKRQGFCFLSSSKGSLVKVSNQYHKRRSEFQLDKQSKMMACTRFWRTLTPSEKTSWQTWASTFPQPVLRRDGRFLTAYQNFIKTNFLQKLYRNNSQYLLKTPVLIEYSQDFVTPQVLVDAESISLKLTFTNADSNLFCLFFVSNFGLSGRSYGNTFWRFCLSTVNLNGTFDITDKYLRYFGILPQIGQKLFISAIFFGKDNGQFYFHKLIQVISEPTPPPFYPVNFGALYNAAAYLNIKNIAPLGWRLPTNSEIFYLRQWLLTFGSGSQHIKDPSLLYWNSIFPGSDNSTLFTGRGAGSRADNGTYQNFKNWQLIPSSVSSGTLNIFYGLVDASSSTFTYAAFLSKKTGTPVRLVQSALGVPNFTEGELVGNDGKKYKTVVLNGLKWTQSNIVETLYRDLTPIPKLVTNAAWAADTTGGWCSPNGNDSNL